LPQCDRVLVLRCDGVRSYISEQGTYSELIAQEHSELTQLMATYSITTEQTSYNGNSSSISATDGDHSVDNDDMNTAISSANGSVNGSSAESDVAVCDAYAFIHLDDNVSEADNNYDAASQDSVDSESVTSMQSAYSHVTEINDGPTEEMIAAITTTDDTATAASTTGTTAATAGTTDATATAAVNTGDSVVAGARLVQDEKMAVGHVQWQVYKTYFNEGSGGT
jgi:hypothetical protein